MKGEDSKGLHISVDTADSSFVPPAAARAKSSPSGSAASTVVDDRYEELPPPEPVLVVVESKKAKKLPPFLLPDTTGGARRSLRDYVVAAVVAARVGWTATEDEPWEELQDEEEEIDLASVHSLEYYYDNDIDLYADGDDIRSLFELRESGKACVGAVASVAWQAGWCWPWARPVRCNAFAPTITRGGWGIGTALSCWRLIRQHLVPLSASCPPFPVCPFRALFRSTKDIWIFGWWD